MTDAVFPTPWSEDLEKQLTELCGHGISFALIAEQMPGFSRNAIIGKAYRMNLRDLKADSLKHLSPIAKARITVRKDRKPSYHSLKPTNTATATAKSSEPISNTTPVEYMKLQPHHCRALLDSRGSDGLLLSCGATRARCENTGCYASSFCPQHDCLYRNRAVKSR